MMSEGASTSLEAVEGFFESPLTKDETSTGEQRKELAAVLEGVRLEAGYHPDRERQGRVLANLPNNLAEQLRGHLHAAYQEFEFFKERRGEEGKEFNDRAVVRGELFELLVENDSQLNQQTKVAEEFLALLHDPARFELAAELSQHRNPDLATFDEESLVISSIGEAKLGLLDFRAYQQFRQRGFSEGITVTVELLNRHQDLTSLGLTGLAEVLSGGQRLAVDENFKQILVVPANRDTQNPELLIKRQSFGHARDYDRFAEILEDSRKVEIKKAAFGVAEVNALVDHLMPKILNAEKAS